MKVLVFQSNSDSNQQLALSREADEIKRAAEAKAPDAKISIRYVTTLDVLEDDLRASDTKYLHFSGHGSESGICLESNGRMHLLDSAGLAKLFTALDVHLDALFLNCCYSASHAQVFTQVSRTVVVCQGTVLDDAAIIFAKLFYQNLFHTKDPTKAFRAAVASSELRNPLASTKYAILSRKNDPDDIVLTAFVGDFPPIEIELTPLRSFLSNRPLISDDILDSLTRKIRVHRWIFKDRGDNVPIPVGRYCVLVSWDEATSRVICKRIVIPNEEKNSISALVAFFSACIAYNKLITTPYRFLDLGRQQITLSDRTVVKFSEALSRFEQLSDEFTSRSPGLRTIMAQALAYMSEASLLAEEHFSAQLVRYLESALSAMHDMLLCVLDELE